MPVIEKVSPEQALERVQSALGDAVSSSALNHGQVDVTCSPDSLVAVIEKLRDADGIRCEFFTFLSGVDRTEFLLWRMDDLSESCPSGTWSRPKTRTLP